MKVRIIHFKNRDTTTDVVSSGNLELAIIGYAQANGHKLKEHPEWVSPDEGHHDVYQMKAMAEDGVITAQAQPFHHYQH